MSYVDGMVIAVANHRKDEFIAFAQRMAPIMAEFGALNSVDCWGDEVPEGKVTSFPMAVQAGADETVCFGWVVWPDRATRDAGFERMMKDPRCAPATNPLPFDGMRMILGGFTPVSGEP